MTAKRKRVIVGLVAVALVAIAGTETMAQCATCGETIAYQPVAYQAYSPVVYSAYRPYTRWYPGYWLGRVNRAIWGRPAYTSYYTPYYASYQPAYTVGYAPTAYYATSYAPATTCSSCTSYYSPYTSCAMPVSTVREVVMRPVCTTSCAPACDPCSGCSTCTTSVDQAAYEVPSGCPGCAVSPAPSTVAPPTAEPPPTLSPSEAPPAERTFRREPIDDSVTPAPADANDDNNASYFEAPQLFNPKDRTAQTSATPVWNAVYHKPVAAGQASADPASWHVYDAAGWVSASQ